MAPLRPFNNYLPFSFYGWLATLQSSIALQQDFKLMVFQYNLALAVCYLVSKY